MIDFMRKHKFVAIMRNIDPAFTERTARALYDGGVRLFEVTFNPSDADTVKKTGSVIEKLNKMFDGTALVGAGTVLTLDFAHIAHSAGAVFIVSPSTDASVMDYTKRHGMLSIPGAYTPTEIMTAHNLGADVVKIFPVAADEIGYLKNILSPLSHIPFMVTGGINADSISEFMKLNPVAVGAGTSLVTNDMAKDGRWDEICRNAKRHIEKVRNF